MNAPKVDFLALLGVLELALVFLVIALVFVFRSKALARRVRALRQQLGEAAGEQEQVGFDQYLRDEIIRNEGLVDEAAVAEDENERQAASLLEMRKKFLELELAAQEVQRNPVEFRNRIAAGIAELVEELRPAADTVVAEQAGDEGEIAVLQADLAAETDLSEGRELHDTHDEELDHLREVINNQQDAMALLRANLKDIEGSDINEILAKLDQFERESRELHQSMEVLEAENERLKQSRGQGGRSVSGPSGSDGAPQLDGLRSMVGQQKATIASLETLIKELAPDAAKAKELAEALAGIRRTNEELNGCVAVLEDENAMLREELEEIHAYLDQQEQDRLAQETAEEDAGTATANESQRELEIKVQELEALVEFKDAAIEELEKQYNTLQSKYLAETGKNSID